MTGYTFDDSKHPIVLVTMDGPMDDVQFRSYLSDLSGNLSRRQTTVVIIDARRARDTTAHQRKMQADWMRENEKRLRDFTLATIMVISSPAVRGFLTAILWLQPMPCPHAVVATLEEAHDRAREFLLRI